MYFTLKLKAMLGLLITTLVFRRVLMIDNSINYHEPILQNVTIYSIDNSAYEVPLFMLKADSATFQAICFRNSTAQQLMSFSLAICRTLGYDALQRVYSVDAHLLDSVYHSKGLLLDINCNSPEPELQHCQWHHTKTVSCSLYLGVHCAECHHTVEITEDMEQEIIFPIHMPCKAHAYCDWNIRNNQIMKKAVLEFKKRNIHESLPIASLSATAGEILEVQWFDSENGNWTTIRENFTKFVSMGPIRIQSPSILLRYFFAGCQFFDPTRLTHGNIASLKYYSEEYVLHKAEAVSYFIPIAICTILTTFIMMLVTCACCYIRRRKQMMYSKHDFTMTYTPGLNVTYDEDETKPADVWPAVYHHLSLEDQNVCLSSLISNYSNRPRTSKLEVSNCGKANHPPIHSLQQHENKQKKILSSLGDYLLSCFMRKASSYSAHISKSLSGCSINNLSDDSLEHQLQKFDSLILSFQWTDSTESASSDSITHADNQLIDSVKGKTTDFCSGQLQMDDKFHHAELLKNAVTQFATQPRKSTVKAQMFGPEEEEEEEELEREEVFSCSSRGSLHSFHSAYPFAHNSVSSLDSFISIRSELQD